MDRYEIGMLAKSKAGHDAGKVYVIIDVDETYVYLADGRIRTLGHLKKKKKKQPESGNAGYRKRCLILRKNMERTRS